jgi:hypothetical protein
MREGGYIWISQPAQILNLLLYWVTMWPWSSNTAHTEYQTRHDPESVPSTPIHTKCFHFSYYYLPIPCLLSDLILHTHTIAVDGRGRELLGNIETPLHSHRIGSGNFSADVEGQRRPSVYSYNSDSTVLPVVPSWMYKVSINPNIQSRTLL